MAIVPLHFDFIVIYNMNMHKILIKKLLNLLNNQISSE